MREKEIQLFTDAMKKANEEFYLDAIPMLEQFINEFPDSELVDDALYDIGLCYFNMNQYDKALEYFNRVINLYPHATITVLTGGNEYGFTGAKSLFAIINCYLVIAKQQLAIDTLVQFEKFPNSYVVDEKGEKKTFKELSQQSINFYNNQIIS